MWDLIFTHPTLFFLSIFTMESCHILFFCFFLDLFCLLTSHHHHQLPKKRKTKIWSLPISQNPISTHPTDFYLKKNSAAGMVRSDEIKNGGRLLMGFRWPIGPGSSPPTCRYKCGRCFPCRPMHVSIRPGVSTPLDYYPETWRCWCGNRYYMP